MMKWDIFIFECSGLWDSIGNPKIYPLARFLKLNTYEENLLSYSFPDKCDFHEPFCFCKDIKIDLINLYQFAEENNINLVAVPHKWCPPIDRNALMEFLDYQEGGK